jgi:molybdate transport system substrate-binding protein
MNRLPTRFITILLVLLLATPVLAAPTTITLAAAAGLTPVLRDIIAAYQASHPEHSIQPNFASSGTLAKQIVAGAPADVFIAANPQWMAYLQEQRQVDAKTVATFTRNTLVCAGPAASKVVDFGSLPALNKIALGNPASAPVGEYARQALTASGIYQTLLDNRQIVFTQTVREALVYAEQQLVDACFIYATEAGYSAKVKIFFTVPQELYPPITFPLALTTAGSTNKSAQEFYNFLLSAQAQQLLQQHGFKE